MKIMKSLKLCGIWTILMTGEQEYNHTLKIKNNFIIKWFQNLMSLKELWRAQPIGLIYLKKSKNIY